MKPPEGVGRCKVCHAHERVYGEEDRDILPEGYSVGDPLPNRDLLFGEVGGLFSEGHGPSRIHRMLQPMVEAWPDRFRPSVDSIERHTAGHVRDVTRRAHLVVRRRMAEAGDPRGDPLRFVDPVMDSVWMLAMESRRRIATGEIEVRTVREAIKATLAFREAHDAARAGSGSRADILERDLEIFLSVAEDMLGRDAYQELKRRFMAARSLPG